MVGIYKENDNNIIFILKLLLSLHIRGIAGLETNCFGTALQLCYKSRAMPKLPH